MHSTPGRPQGRGKIERFFRSVREQFLVELTEDRLAQVSDLAELNRLFTAWVETVYHPAIHSETGAAPLRRWCEGVPDPLPRPSPAQLREAFLWSEYRTVTKTATVSLHANLYQVDELLVGRRVELVFDPFDLTEIEVRYGGRSFGAAVAFTIGRHSHPKARPEQPAITATPTGIDYLHLIDTAHTEALQRRINYAALTGQHPRRQLDLLTGAPTSSDDQLRRTARPAHRRRVGEDRPTQGRGVGVIDRLQGFFGFTRTPFGRDLAPGMLHRHAATARPSPGSAGASPSTGSGSSPARSAPGRPSRSAPHSPGWTRPGTPSSTCPTPPSGSAASTTRSSPRWAGTAPDPPRHPGPASRRRARDRAGRTRPHPRRGDRRGAPARPRPTGVDPDAHLMPSPRLCRGDHGGERVALAGEGRPSRPLGITAARGSRLASPGALGSREGGGREEVDAGVGDRSVGAVRGGVSGGAGCAGLLAVDRGVVSVLVRAAEPLAGRAGARRGGPGRRVCRSVRRRPARRPRGCGAAGDPARDVLAAGLPAAGGSGTRAGRDRHGRRWPGGAGGRVRRVPAHRTWAGRDDDRLVSPRRRDVPLGCRSAT